MLYSSLIKIGEIPQDRFNFRQVRISEVHPTIGHPGRNLDTILAVWPDLVTVMMALASISMAVIQVAWELAVVISFFSSFFRTLDSSLYGMSLSVRTAIRTIVFSASTGYFPAAVSPDSMIALVP